MCLIEKSKTWVYENPRTHIHREITLHETTGHIHILDVDMSDGTVLGEFEFSVFNIPGLYQDEDAEN